MCDVCFMHAPRTDKIYEEEHQMKKLLALVMVACMVFGLVACGAPASQTTAAEPAAPAAAAPAAEAPAAAPAKADEPKPYDGVTLRVILASHDWTIC